MTRVLILGAKAYPAFSDAGIASGGMEQYVENLVPRLCDLGIEIDLVTGTTGKSAPTQEYFGGQLRVHRGKLVGGTLIQPVVLAIRSVRDSIVLGKKADVLNPQTPLAAFVCLIPKLLYDKRLVLTHHALTSDPKYSKRPLVAMIYRAIERAVLRRCDHLISVGRSLTLYLKGRYGIDCPVTLVPTGVNVRANLREEGKTARSHEVSDNPFTIIFIARLIPWKRPLDLAKVAVDEFASEDYRFIFVGEGEARTELENFIVQAGVKGRHCRITGKVSEKEKQEILAAADLFVLPSENEVFPVSILEALAAGVPVVAADVGDVKDIIDDSEAGFAYTVGDSCALSARIRQIVESPEVHALLRKNALAYAQRQSWESRAKSYAEALKGRSRAAGSGEH